jgi:predicted transcriptional regulator
MAHLPRERESEKWRLSETRKGILDLDSGHFVSHKQVTRWLRSWGKPGETKPPSAASFQDRGNPGSP